MKKKALSLLLTLSMLLGMVPAFSADAEAADAHNHTGWTEWSGEMSITSLSGNVVLTGDVTNTAAGNPIERTEKDGWEGNTKTVNKPIAVSGTVNLCLNGYVLDLNDGYFNVQNGATLNIYDCGSTTYYFTDTKIFYEDTDTEAGWRIDGVKNGTDGSYETYTTVKPDSMTGVLTVIGGCITGGRGCPVGQWNDSGDPYKYYNRYGGAVYVNDGGTLHLFGGNLVGNSATKDLTFTKNIGDKYGGGAVYLCANATFIMDGGSIIGNMTSNHGGAVNTHYSQSSFVMNGGKISYNDAGQGNGAYITSNFLLTGGEISHNSSHSSVCCGSGVYLASGTFSMTGGSIMCNSGYRGAGLFVAGGSAKLTGGIISQNSASSCSSGVSVVDGKQLTIGGTIKIKDNVNSDLDGCLNWKDEMKYGTVFLGTGDDAPKSGMEVGVSILGTFIASGAAETDKQYFFSNKANYNVTYADGAISLSSGTNYAVTIGTTTGGTVAAHPYAEAGETVVVSATPDSSRVFGGMSWSDGNSSSAITETNGVYSFTMPASDVTINASFEEKVHYHNGVNFTQTLSGEAASAVTLGAASTTTKYYLSGDYTNLQNTGITIAGTVNLCLNGYILNLNGGYIDLPSGATLNIYDCGTTARYFTDGDSPKDGCFESYSAAKPAGTEGTDYLKVTGGCITGGRGKLTSNTTYGGAILNYGGTLTLAAGNIVGNAASNAGGVGNIEGAVFTMTGGSITGNAAKSSSGGVSNGANSTFTMTGGSIIGNTSGVSGGGVINNHIFNFSGGCISCNSSSQGGGVANSFGTMTMNGTAQIIGNEATYGGGLFNSATLKLGGTAVIIGNTANSAASNLMLFNANITPVDPAWTTPIGVSMLKVVESVPTVSDGVITTEAVEAKYFSADITTQRVSLVASGENAGKLQLESVPIVEDLTGTTVTGGDETITTSMKNNLPKGDSDTNVRAVMNGASQLQVKLKEVTVTGDTNKTVTKATFDVYPKDNQGNTVTTPSTGEVTFKLPIVSNDATYLSAKVAKGSEDIGTYAIEGNSVTVSIDEFTGGTYSYELSKVNIANIQNTSYDISLTLNDSIDMNLYVKPADSSAKSCYRVEASFDGKQTANVDLSGVAYDSTNGCKVKVTDVLSYQMTQPVSIKVFYTDNLSSETVVAKSFRYTVQKYCEKMYETCSDTSCTVTGKNELALLCKACLDYGTEAQKYFSGRRYGENRYPTFTAEDYANKNLSGNGLSTVAKPEFYGSLSNTNSNLSYYDVSLILASQAAVKFYFKYTGSGTPELSWFTCDITSGQQFVPSELKDESKTMGSGMWSVKLSGVAPAKLGEHFTFTITEPGKGAMTINYSALSYASYEWNNKDFGTLMKALANYGNCASAYFAACEPK